MGCFLYIVPFAFLSSIYRSVLTKFEWVIILTFNIENKISMIKERVCYWKNMIMHVFNLSSFLWSKMTLIKYRKRIRNTNLVSHNITIKWVLLTTNVRNVTKRYKISEQFFGSSVVYTILIDLVVEKIDDLEGFLD